MEEPVMSKGFLSVAILFGGAALLAGAGCSSDNGERPYELTGTTPTYSTSTGQRLAWTDEKNHYRPEFQAGINRPPQFPKEVVTNYPAAP
jgi:hypothetical protein